MSDGLAELIKEVKDARETLAEDDAERLRIFDEMKAENAKLGAALTETQTKLAKVTTEMAEVTVKLQTAEASINELSKARNRPGRDNTEFSDEAGRKAAIALLQLKHTLLVPKIDTLHPFGPADDQIKEAEIACKAISSLMHCTDIVHLPEMERKALSAFALGSHGFILRPEQSDRILSCLVDQTDVAGLMQNINISGPSIEFMVDNVVFDNAAWACETNCFANSPQANLSGLGTLEIKPETLRYIVCATRTLLEDAATNIESWMLAKVQRAFRYTISDAIIKGDGIGKPMGILSPASGIPVCDTSDHTPANQFTWQDLVMLKWEVPMQYQGNGRYLMNQRTFGLCLTMSDASGRPIMIPIPLGTPGANVVPGTFSLNGTPTQIVTQMPDVAPGATPVAYGNWNEAYVVVNRKAVTMQQDPYSAGFCVLFKFEGRIGGAIICPLAARLLRTK